MTAWHGASDAKVTAAFPDYLITVAMQQLIALTTNQPS